MSIEQALVRIDRFKNEIELTPPHTTQRYAAIKRGHFELSRSS